MAVAIQSVMHVNVNCSDIERSLDFYREIVGLTPAAHTNPPPQKGFPMAPGDGHMDSGVAGGEVQWDAWILQDARGFAAPSLDLLEWRMPRPMGRPYHEAHHIGFARLGVAVPDVAAAYSRANGAGVACLSPPGRIHVESELDTALFVALDPDGVKVEFVESSGVAAPQLLFVDVSCSDHARSLEWYQRVLGLEVLGRWGPDSIPGELHAVDGEAAYEVAYLRPPGHDSFAIDLVQWHRPEPVGRPYPSANHLGLYRMAFLVEDIRASYDELRRQGVSCPPPVRLDMGPEIPIDGLWALFFPDPDGICLELIESPRLD